MLCLIDQFLANHAPDQHDAEGKAGIQQTLDHKHESLVRKGNQNETSHGHDHKEQGEHQVHVHVDEIVESSGQSEEGVETWVE